MATRVWVPAPATAGLAACAQSLPPKYNAAPRDSTPTIQVIDRFTIRFSSSRVRVPHPPGGETPMRPLPPQLEVHPLWACTEGWLLHQMEMPVKAACAANRDRVARHPPSLL